MFGHSKTASKQDKLSEEAQRFWLHWVEAAFPDLDSRACFLPPVYFNRVLKIRRSIDDHDVCVLPEAPGQAGQSKHPTTTAAHPTDAQPTDGQSDMDVQSPPKKTGKIKHLSASIRKLLPSSRTEKTGEKSGTSIQYSDFRDDAASHRIFCCLQTMFEINGEVLVGLSQLQFGQYLGEPCYAAAAAQLPVSANLPSVLPQNWKRGDFDVLLIHRHYGLVVCEVKAFRDNLHKLKMSQQDIDNNIRKRLTDAVSQLDKAEAMLSHLVSDVTPCLRITKTIAVPNLTACQVQQAISGDPLLTQALCRCLGTTNPAIITAMCLCSDQLSDPKTPWDVTSDVLKKLRNWWQRRVTVSEPNDQMACDVYKTLVARFCGPATTVAVQCTFLPRLCVKTLGHAVSWTGQCYTAQISLFPEQVDLLNRAPPRLFVAGPPGTGKTVVLLLMATEWMRWGNDVHIVSGWSESSAACFMLHNLLLKTVIKQLTSVASPGQPRLLLYDFTSKKDVKTAVKYLSQTGSKTLHVIADEVGRLDDFQTFCEELLKKVPDLHLWAASCYHGDAPAGWQVEYLTRPLRSPPAVVREVQQDVQITVSGVVQPYSERGVPDHTDGPPVRRLYHRGQGHSGDWPGDCVTCGRDVASFLHSLGIEEHITGGSTATPCLKWRDVLVLYWFGDITNESGVVTGLREKGVPVCVMKDCDTKDVATALSNVVWVARGSLVRGLERKIVVCLESNAGVDFTTVRLHSMSRCTSQLVLVLPELKKLDLNAKVRKS